MSKIDDAIKHFKQRANRATHDQLFNDSVAIADAFEEIRDRIAPDGINMDQWMRSISQTIAFGTPVEQPGPTEQPPLEPWDCVKAKPGTSLYDVYTDAELVCGFLDSDGDRKVFNPDDDSDRGAYHCDDSDLIFMRRLKPRHQPEPTYGTEPTNEDLLRAVGYVQKEPTFKAGNWIYDEETDRQEEITEVHDRTVVTKAGRILYKSLVKKIDNPGLFQVGDWVETSVTKRHVQITGIQYNDLGKGVAQFTNAHGQTEYIGTEYITKITPPAPRFAFGDRVRWEECPEAEGLITSDHGNGWYDVAFKDGTHPDPMDVIHGEKLRLDSSTD